MSCGCEVYRCDDGVTSIRVLDVFLSEGGGGGGVGIGDGEGGGRVEGCGVGW